MRYRCIGSNLHPASEVLVEFRANSELYVQQQHQDMDKRGYASWEEDVFTVAGWLHCSGAQSNRGDERAI